MKLRDWVKLPSAWIEAGGLKAFMWKEGRSGHTAALMLLLAIAHHAREEDGVARLPYDDLERITQMSRTKIAEGLRYLESKGLIVRSPEGQSTYQLAGYDKDRGWAMLPARSLYASGEMKGFSGFHLRQRSELDALKAYLAFAARRDRSSNAAYITREQLHQYAGIPEGRITAAISLLAAASLIIVEQHQSRADPSRIAQAYRLTHLNPRQHQGTIGRAGLIAPDAEFQSVADVLNL